MDTNTTLQPIYSTAPRRRFTPSEIRIAAREDESLANEELENALARCLAEGIS